MRPPPALTVTMTWRSLYASGAFAQRELVDSSTFRSAAQERSLNIGLGQEPLEDLDLAGALQPIAFADEGYWRGWTVPAEPSDRMTFREQTGPVPWVEYSRDEDGFATVTPLYSPWQLLYLDDVLEGTGGDVGAKTLLLGSSERDRALETVRELFQAQTDHWSTLDEAWRPLLKLVVRLQNYYWPRVAQVAALVHNPEGEGFIEAGEEARRGFELNAQSVLDELGCSADEVLRAYHFLVERGFDREPQDGLVMLRRARPRAYHLRWRGLPRRAQDHFDAADVLRRFLVDVTGEQPAGPSSWVMDGRQTERARLFERGPAARFTPDELKSELDAAELYPHGVHVVGEGSSEEVIVTAIVGAVFGWPGVNALTFSDLQGSGSAARVEELVRTIGAYSLRTVVIVDQEGRMAEYLLGAFKRETIDEADVLMFEDSLEAQNSSAAELVDLVAEVARDPQDNREVVELTIDAAALVDEHAKRRAKTDRRSQPGLADTLLLLAGTIHRCVSTSSISWRPCPGASWKSFSKASPTRGSAKDSSPAGRSLGSSSSGSFRF
jgi:hypothetical protein